MRCSCCNKILNDWEATARHAVTNEFLDTCSKCLDGLEIPVKGRKDLETTMDVDSEDTYDC